MINSALFDTPPTQVNPVFRNWLPREGLAAREWGGDVKIDLSEDGNTYYVRAALPGVKKQDIHVDIDGNRISISTEIDSAGDTRPRHRARVSETVIRRAFSSFSLDTDIDAAKAEAIYKNGVLELKLPKQHRRYGKRLCIN